MNEAAVLDVTRLQVLLAVARHGSVTAAAAALNYAQPSVSHHLARLEAETGARLVQRAGRGIRLTEAGRLLADRAEEIIGRLDAAESELDAVTGMRAGRVRLAAFPSALGTFAATAVAEFRVAHPGVEVSLSEAEPPEAIAALRAGEVELALAFSHEPADLPAGIRAVPLLDEPLYLVTAPDRTGTELADFADTPWIAGCARCRGHLLACCADAGFTPTIAFTTDDYVAVQSLVAAGVAVSTLPGLAITAARNASVRITRIPGAGRHVVALTYGEAPDPPATEALLAALRIATTALPRWPE
ncbi:MAG TPA: LysR family transcriptional regulator [Pseudonocardiaceae bacterium]|jgi:DNA-binding transcriptional LysR family regulator|nr:LysR family transcriptional regulator [Pseudonocardiaceae bacterium]